MNGALKVVCWVVGFIFGAWLLLVSCDRVMSQERHLHGVADVPTWYDGECCNQTDCRQTVLHEVERRDGGWLVVITGELIPFDDTRIRRSLDAIMHVCLRRFIWNYISTETVRCLYVPEVPV